MTEPATLGTLVLILNLVMPGVGGLVYTFSAKEGQDIARIKKRAIAQAGLFWAGILLAVLTKITLVAALAAWIWALVDRIGLYRGMRGGASG